MVDHQALAGLTARFAYIERRVGFGRLLGKELPFYMTDQKIISIACSFHFWFRFSTECFDQCLATELMDTSYCSSFRVSNFMTHRFLLLTLIYLFFFFIVIRFNSMDLHFCPHSLPTLVFTSIIFPFVSDIFSCPPLTYLRHYLLVVPYLRANFVREWG